MKWIHATNSTLSRGTTTPPAGNVYFVDTDGSAALINGKLYINGKLAPQGRHEIALGNITLPIDVNAQGNATKRPVITLPLGGKP